MGRCGRYIEQNAHVLEQGPGHVARHVRLGVDAVGSACRSKSKGGVHEIKTEVQQQIRRGSSLPRRLLWNL